MMGCGSPAAVRAAQGGFSILWSRGGSVSCCAGSTFKLYCFRRNWTNASNELVYKEMEVGRVKRERKQCTGEEKVAILRKHLLEGMPVSDVCEDHGLRPTVFYRWQKQFFEQGAVVFEVTPIDWRVFAPSKGGKWLSAGLL